MLPIVTLDFETYFDTKYTLKKLSSTEYIRDSQFHIHCVGIRLPSQRTARTYHSNDILPALQDIDWDKHALLAHHTQFDGLILSDHFDIKPAYYCDTLSMARALHYFEPHDLDYLCQLYGIKGKVKDVLPKTKGLRELPPKLMKQLMHYCKQDVNATYKLFQLMLKDFPQDELDLIDETVRLFVEPVLRVNQALAKRVYEHEVERKEQALEQLGLTREDVRSDSKFAELLVAAGGQVPTKYSEKQKKVVPTFAKTNKEFQALATHPKPAVRELAQLRTDVKSEIIETRSRTLIVRTCGGKALPVYLNYHGAHTSRWSGGDKLNPQNFNRGSDLRKCLVAPPNHVLVVVDSSQIEARVTAYLAGEQELLEAFADPKRDVYCEFAERIYGHPIDKKKHEDKRFIAKTATLGLGFNMGAEKYQITLAQGTMGPPKHISLEEAYRVVQLYRSTHPNITDLWRELTGMLPLMMKEDCDISFKDGLVHLRHEHIALPNGLFLHYPELFALYNPRNERYDDFTYKARHMRTKIYGGLMLENLVQCLARIIVGEQLLRVRKKYKLVMFTHDELVLCVPRAQARECYNDTMAVMRTPPVWAPDLPLDAEGGFAHSYSK